VLRRHFLLSGLAPVAGPPVVALARQPELLHGLGAGFRFFRRAYAARPTREAAVLSLETGFYPHAAAGKPHLLRVLDWQGGPLPPAPLLIVTAAHGGLEDDWQERSVRVPLAVRGRGFEPGADDALVSMADVARGLERRESVFSHGKLGQPGEWRMVVRGLDKMVANARMEVVGLFNLGPDPREETNLAESEGHGLLRDELLAHLRAWMKRIAYRIDPSGLKQRP
jgi:hypothetical protein